MSGLPVDRFRYVGFLPRRTAARQAELKELASAGGDVRVSRSAAPRRARCSHDIADVCPDWDVCIGREVTKVFEEFRRGRAVELAEQLVDDEPRGEFTVRRGAEQRHRRAVTPTEIDLDRLVRALLEQGVTPRTISHALAALPGVSRKEAYARVLAIADER